MEFDVKVIPPLNSNHAVEVPRYIQEQREDLLDRERTISNNSQMCQLPRHVNTLSMSKIEHGVLLHCPIRWR